MCQGCYGSWSLVNEQCPLDSADLAESARAHQSRAWPCIPYEVWINELWTSNSRITTHESSNPARWNLQRTKMLEKSTSTSATYLSLNIVTRTGSGGSGGDFKSLQLSDGWESTTNWAACQTASFTKQIKLLTGRVCLSADCTATIHSVQSSDKRSWNWILDITSMYERSNSRVKLQDISIIALDFPTKANLKCVDRHCNHNQTWPEGWGKVWCQA